MIRNRIIMTKATVITNSIHLRKWGLVKAGEDGKNKKAHLIILRRRIKYKDKPTM